MTTRTHSRFVTLAAAAFLAAFAGCGGPGSTTAPPPGVEDALRDLGDLLKLLGDQKQRPPAKQSELDAFEPTAPHAVAALQSKQIAYTWGSGLTPGGKAVIAHDANAESAGGHVLLQDGTVKKLSAAEFAAAPKAAGKK